MARDESASTSTSNTQSTAQSMSAGDGGLEEQAATAPSSQNPGGFTVVSPRLHMQVMKVKLQEELLVKAVGEAKGSCKLVQEPFSNSVLHGPSPLGLKVSPSIKMNS